MIIIICICMCVCLLFYINPPLNVDCFFTLLNYLLCCVEAFNFMPSHSSILGFISWATRILCKMLLSVTVSWGDFSPVVVSDFQDLHQDLWSILNWFFYRVRDRNLLWLVFRLLSSFSSTVYWRDCLLQCMLLTPLAKSDSCSYMRLFLGSLFYSVDPHVC